MRVRKKEDLFRVVTVVKRYIETFLNYTENPKQKLIFVINPASVLGRISKERRNSGCY